MEFSADVETARLRAVYRNKDSNEHEIKTLMTFIKDMLTYLPSKLLPALTGFISAPILTRLFLPDEYSNYVLALGVSEFLYALACSGLGSGILRFFPAYKVKSKLSVFFATIGGSVGIIITIISAVSFSTLYLFRSHLPDALYPLFQISIIVFMVQSAVEVLKEVVRAQQRSKLYTATELFFRYGSLGLSLLLVIVLGFRVEGLLWGTILASVLTLPPLLLLIAKGVKVQGRDFSLPDASQMWHYAWPLALSNVAMWGLRLSDRYIINLFRSGIEVGQYSVAYNLASKSIDIIVAMFLLSTGPMIMNKWENQGRKATETALRMITRLYLILCLPAAAGLCILASPFITLFTSKPYHEGYRIVGYIAFSSFAWGLTRFAITGTLIMKESRKIAINQIAATLATLILNLLLIPRFGFLAAGITTLIGYTLLLVLQAYVSRLYLTWQFPFRTLRNVVIATSCMGLSVLGIYPMPNVGGGVRPGYLILSIIAAVPIYFCCLWLLGEANEEEKNAFKRLLIRVVKIAE
jgi:O-antigen/teichoic acid export membrane protein